MGEMDDPLQKFVEQYYDQMVREATKLFPQRRADIDHLLMGGGPKHEGGEKRSRRVKSSRGRPPINKSVLVGWLSLLVQIIGFAEFKTRIDKGERRSIALKPSNRWVFDQIAELGLSYTIDEGANLIRYPLTSASTLKRHYAFSSSNAFDDLAAMDAVHARHNLSRNLSPYLGRPPIEEAYYCMQLGDDPDDLKAHWDFLMSVYIVENPEPWRRDFQVTQRDTESGPQMTLHFPPIKKSSWTALQMGLGMWGYIEIGRLKNEPPSKEEIAEYQDFRRNNPISDPPKLWDEVRKIHGS